MCDCPSSPADTCTSVTVSGVGDLDGTYDKIQPPYGYTDYYYRAGGVDTYYVNKGGNYWNIENESGTLWYRVSHGLWCGLASHGSYLGGGAVRLSHVNARLTHTSPSR